VLVAGLALTATLSQASAEEAAARAGANDAGAAEAPSATGGLPLVPTRTIAFETDQGTWLSVDVAPEGRTLVFDLLGDLYALGSTGGEARRLTSGIAFDSQPAWSPDGTQIAYLSDRSGAENLWVMRADGTAPRQVTHNDGPDEFVSPAWARDGGALYVSLYRADRNAVELWRYDLVNDTRDELSTRGVNALGAAPSPDGRYVYYAMRAGPVFEDDVRLPLWSIQRRELASQRIDTVVTNVGSAMRPVLSPDGTQLAYAVRRDGATALRLRDLTTGVDRELLFPIQHDAQEAVPSRDLLPGYGFTPDGREVVLTRAGGLARVSTATGATRPIPFRAQVELELGPLLRQALTQETGPVRARLIQEPRQSPDGKRLAFSALGRIYLVDLRPGAQPQRLTRDDRGPPEFHPNWSPDGRSLAYVTWTRADAGAIWIADTSSRAARRLTHNDAFLYSDVVLVPEGGTVMALRSPADERHATILEPMWTGRSGGFLRPAELVEIALNDGAARVLASGPMDGTAQFTRERDRVYLHTDAGLEAIARDGSWRKPALKVVGPPYYFKDEPAPASDIKVSPDGRHALVLFAQQAYLVAMPPPGAVDTGVDLTRADAPARRLTTVGADFSSWSRDGASVAWAVGSTFCQLPLASILQLPESATSAAAARTTLRSSAKCVDARVERPRDSPAEATSWVLRGATLVTMRGDEVIADADLLVRGNRIAALGPRGQVAVPRDARIVDASGRFVVPGFIDAHMHVGGIRRNVLQLDDWSLRATLAYGVTTLLDPSSLSIDMFAYGDLIDAGLVTGPRLYTTGTAMFSFNRLESLDDARDLLALPRFLPHSQRQAVPHRLAARAAVDCDGGAGARNDADDRRGGRHEARVDARARWLRGQRAFVRRVPALSRRRRADGALGHEHGADADDLARRAARGSGLHRAHRCAHRSCPGGLVPAERARQVVRARAMGSGTRLRLRRDGGRCRHGPAGRRHRRARLARELPGNRHPLGNAGARGGRDDPARGAAGGDARVGDDHRAASRARQSRARQARGLRPARGESARGRRERAADRSCREGWPRLRRGLG